MLHIHCGDSSGDALRKAGVVGDVTVWCDLLHEGPAPAGLDDTTCLRTRAEFLSHGMRGARTPEQVHAWLLAQDQRLERATQHDEAVLWFDACLYDQLILIRQFDRFSRPDLRDVNLSLICIGAFPGKPRFKGLGELTPQELASLLPTRRAVTAAQRELANRAWAAFRAPAPTGIEDLLRSDTAALPFLGPALTRHLEQFPSTRNGLNRLENAVLDVVATRKSRLPEIFVAVSDLEARPFFGDTTLWACLDTLTRLPTPEAPVLRIDGPGPLPLWNPPRDLSAWCVSITPTGERVRAGQAPAIDEATLDVWRGGVHLRQGNLWRWDEQRRRLCAPQPAAGNPETACGATC